MIRIGITSSIVQCSSYLNSLTIMDYCDESVTNVSYLGDSIVLVIAEK